MREGREAYAQHASSVVGYVSVCLSMIHLHCLPLSGSSPLVHASHSTTARCHPAGIRVERNIIGYAVAKQRKTMTRGRGAARGERWHLVLLRDDKAIQVSIKRSRMPIPCRRCHTLGHCHRRMPPFCGFVSRHKVGSVHFVGYPWVARRLVAHGVGRRAAEALFHLSDHNPLPHFSHIGSCVGLGALHGVVNSAA
jgi:hypothetical protein